MTLLSLAEAAGHRRTAAREHVTTALTGRLITSLLRHPTAARPAPKSTAPNSTAPEAQR